MNATVTAAPAVVRQKIKVEQLTCAIGAQLHNVNLGDASRDDALFTEIRALLVQHKVLFLRDQDITRAEHVAFARRFGCDLSRLPRLLAAEAACAELPAFKAAAPEHQPDAE